VNDDKPKTLNANKSDRHKKNDRGGKDRKRNGNSVFYPHDKEKSLVISH